MPRGQPCSDLEFAQGLDQWFQKIEKLPNADAWMLCGKTSTEKPVDGGVFLPVHPTLAHLLEVAAVADRLLARLPRHLYRRLFHVFGGGVRGRKFLLFCCAMHDLGKLTPAFIGNRLARNHVEIRQQYEARGFDFPSTEEFDHGKFTAELVTSLLEQLGWLGARRVARALAAHHGTYHTDAHLTGLGKQTLGKNPRWEACRVAVIQALRTVFRVRTAVPRVRHHDHGGLAFLVDAFKSGILGKFVLNSNESVREIPIYTDARTYSPTISACPTVLLYRKSGVHYWPVVDSLDVYDANDGNGVVATIQATFSAEVSAVHRWDPAV